MKSEIVTSPGRINGWVGVPLFVTLLILCNPAFPEETTNGILELKTEAPELPVGGAFTLGILTTDPVNNLEGAIITDVRFKGLDENWHIAEAWHQSTSDEEAKDNWLWTARLQPFVIGETSIPSVEAVLRYPDGTVEVLELEGPAIHIVDGLDASDVQYRDLEDIHPYRFDRRWIAAWVAGGLLAAIAAWLLFRRLNQRERSGSPAPPPLPPGEWALLEIEKRKMLPECRNGNSKFIASQASDVIRHFLERQYRFAAMEMTTHECVGRLKSTAVPHGFPVSVNTFLTECDLAKFTRVELEEDRKSALWDDARGIIESSLRKAEEPAGSIPDRVESEGSAL